MAIYSLPGKRGVLKAVNGGTAQLYNISLAFQAFGSKQILFGGRFAAGLNRFRFIIHFIMQ
ncbi:MAG: hypothetical protein E5W64_03135 [Mesorhizobium sp.]|nr:MAG: hypothetical protein E5W64_03135 [Mesorhizobium sp.]